MTRRSCRLNRGHARHQIGIIGRAISAHVNTSMAVGTQRNYMRRVVRAAIAKAAQVMRFQVRRAVKPMKGSRVVAALAIPIGARYDIIPDILASLVDSPSAARWCLRSLRSGRQGGSAQFLQRKPWPARLDMLRGKDRV